MVSMFMGVTTIVLGGKVWGLAQKPRVQGEKTVSMEKEQFSFIPELED